MFGFTPLVDFDNVVTLAIGKLQHQLLKFVLHLMHPRQKISSWLSTTFMNIFAG